MKKITLTRLIATIGCLAAAAALSVFLVLASDKTEVDITDTAKPAENPRFVTPKTMGSYGELMFAYIGESNYLYNLDDESKPLVHQPVKELLYASDDSVLFLASCELSEEHPGRESQIQELMVGDHGNQLNTIAYVTLDPCWSSNDEVIYFVKDDEPMTLYTFEPLTSTTEVSAYFDEKVVGLRISSDGLLVTVESGAEYLYVPLSKQLTPPSVSMRGMRITVCEQYDLLMGPEGTLLYHWQGADQSVQISDHCIAALSQQDNEIYYIERTEAGTSLNAFIVSEEEHKRLAELEDNLLPQITADANYAFMVDEQGVVYRYDIQTSTVEPYTFIDLNQVQAPMISLFDYRLMIYDLAAEPDQSFCYAISAETTLSATVIAQNTEQANELRTMNADPLQGPQSSCLSMGSAGENVRQLQELLMRNGYLDCMPNGFYDIPTMEAVRWLQHDQELPETGVANGMLQSILADQPEKPQRAPLMLGDQGAAVSAFQARLYTLGYMVQRPTGIIDDVTLDAMRYFCWQRESEFEGDVISADLIAAVHDPKAEPCYTYLPLALGDECSQAYRLNVRLAALQYTAALPAPDVTQQTLEAAELFCQAAAIAWEQQLTEELQALIFADTASACPPELVPEGGKTQASDTKGQTISDKELKILRKWLTKSFAVNHTDRQAVKRLQMRLIRMGYLLEEQATMIYDADTKAAVMQFQQDNMLAADGIPSKRTLMMIFALDHAQLSGE